MSLERGETLRVPIRGNARGAESRGTENHGAENHGAENQLHLAVQTWGAAGATPVLALHGWLDNAASFDPLAAALDGVRLLAVDLPGHGWSDHRRGGSYFFVDYLVDLLTLADRLELGCFALMGHSLGGAIAAAFAGAFPERVERIVLLDGFSPVTVEPRHTLDRLRAHVSARAAGQRSARVFADVEEAAERIAANRFGPGNEAARVLAARGTSPAPGGVIFRSDPLLRAGAPLSLARAHVDAFLSGVRCPTLAIRAIGGYPFHELTMARFRALVAHADWREIEGSHYVHMERPGEVAGLIQPFLTASSGVQPMPAAGTGL